MEQHVWGCKRLTLSFASFYGIGIKLAHRRKEEKGKGTQPKSRTLLEALAKAIDSTNEEEAVRLAAEFNDSFGHLVRASVDAESIQGDGNTGDKDQLTEKLKPTIPIRRKSLNGRNEEPDRNDTWGISGRSGERGQETEPLSSEDSEARKPKKKE